MRRPRIFRSDGFRLAAVFTLLFLAFTGILTGTVLFIVEGTLRAALTGANDADITTVLSGFRDQGMPEAVKVVKQRLGFAIHQLWQNVRTLSQDTPRGPVIHHPERTSAQLAA